MLLFVLQDRDLFTLDCLHLSAKGNALAAISLWNNMVQPTIYLSDKRSVLRRQSRDTNRNIKKVGVLPIRIVQSDVSSIGRSSERNQREKPSLWRRANARNVRLYYPYWHYTNLFIFRFIYIYINCNLARVHSFFFNFKVSFFLIMQVEPVNKKHSRLSEKSIKCPSKVQEHIKYSFKKNPLESILPNTWCISFNVLGLAILIYSEEQRHCV